MEILFQSQFEEPKDVKSFSKEPLIIHRHEKDSNKKDRAMLILVHGLGGSRYGKKSTWGNIPSFIFEDFPGLDIGIYEYTTLFKRLKFWESVELEQEAEVMAGIVRDAEKYSRIILAGHSMGGLLCMGMLRYFFSSDQKGHLDKITGLLLMATPQAGSQKVPWPASWFSKDFQALKPHGSLVEKIHETFTSTLKHKFVHICIAL